MDGDRENNDISNLLLIPKKLHLQYHFYKKIIDDWDKDTAMDKVSCNTYLLNAFTRFSEICFDCMQYVKLKKYMEKGFDPVGRIDGITRLRK